MNPDKTNEQLTEWKSETRHKEREARIAAMRTGNGGKKPLKENKGVGRLLFPIVAVILVVAILVWGAFSLGLPQKYFVPLKIGSKSVSAVEYGYFYNSTYRQYDRYATQGLLPKNAKGTLDLDALVGELSEKPQTWGEYIEEKAIEQVQQLELLYADAQAEGIKLSDENRKRIDDQINDLINHYGSFNEADNNLIKTFGRGVTLEVLKGITEKIMLVEEYLKTWPDKLTVEKSDVEKYFEENKFDFTGVTYRSYTFALPHDANADSNAKDEDKQKEHAKHMEKLKEEVEQFKNSIHSEEDFIAAARNYARGEDKAFYENPNRTLKTRVLKKNISNHDLEAWLFDSQRKAGDVKVFPGTNSYEIVYFIANDRDESYYPALGQIEFRINQAGNDDKAKEAQKQAEEAMLKVAEQALTEVSDKESLETVGKKLTDAGENVQYVWSPEIITTYLAPEVQDWVNKSERKVGDKAVIKVANGAVLVVFGGRAEKQAWYSAVEGSIKGERIRKSIEDKMAKTENAPVISEWGMRFVDKIDKNTKTGADVAKANEEAKSTTSTGESISESASESKTTSVNETTAEPSTGK